MKFDVKFLPCGDSAITAEFGDKISESINMAVHSFAKAVEALALPAVCEAVPTYRSVTVHYSPILADYSEILSAIAPLAESLDISEQSTKTIEIPVLYGGEYGEDLAFVAQNCAMTQAEVIAIHSRRSYRIYMLGFTPGFPYLGGMDSRIATPRRKQPRVKIPAGSVGIAGAQTGIYPIASPGGWQIIGRTPLKLFDQTAQKPILLEAGQKIKFIPITKAEFNRLSQGGAL